MKKLDELSKKLDEEIERKEIEKRNIRQRQKNEEDAKLDSTESGLSKFITYTFGFLGFLKGCQTEMNSGVDSNGMFNAYNGSFYEIFICPILYPAIGALVGWILVKIIFWIIRSSR